MIPRINRPCSLAASTVHPGVPNMPTYSIPHREHTRPHTPRKTGRRRSGPTHPIDTPTGGDPSSPARKHAYVHSSQQETPATFRVSPTGLPLHTHKPNPSCSCCAWKPHTHGCRGIRTPQQTHVRTQPHDDWASCSAAEVCPQCQPHPACGNLYAKHTCSCMVHLHKLLHNNARNTSSRVVSHSNLHHTRYTGP
jgi:hypothetical protein